MASDKLFDIDGRAAIVTGASSGIGRHAALTLARAGAKVAIAARRLDRLTALAKEIEGFDGRAVPIQLDVTNADSVRAAVAAAETELGPIAILVSASGVAIDKPVFEHSEADWDQVVDTNLKGVWLMAQEVARHMARLGHGGSIVNVASVLAFMATKNNPSYCASKAGVAQLTKALALDLARYRIRVNAIAPGYFDTEMTHDFLSSEPAQAVIKRIPQRRVGAMRDLEGLLLLLASDASAYITGSMTTIDGGISLGW